MLVQSIANDGAGYSSKPKTGFYQSQRPSIDSWLSSVKSPPHMDVSAMEILLQRALQRDVTLRRVDNISAASHFLPTYRLILGDGTRLRLRVPPPSHARLLRHERALMSSSCHVHEIFASSGLPIPRLIAHDASSRTLGLPFLITSDVAGPTLESALPNLSKDAGQNIDSQIGSTLACLGRIRSSVFGSLSEVQLGHGSTSWSMAFHLLLEGVLQDAEDLVVSLPYERVRMHVSRFSDVLDEITKPKLTLLAGGDPENVILNDNCTELRGLVGPQSLAVWGDPALSTVFGNASVAFRAGYGLPPKETNWEHLRQLLYTMFRTVMKITAACYRPRMVKGEMAARKKLMGVLRELDTLCDASPVW